MYDANWIMNGTKKGGGGAEDGAVVTCKCGHKVNSGRDIYFGNFDECYYCHKDRMAREKEAEQRSMPGYGT
jgi:hypothetical protein